MKTFVFKWLPSALVGIIIGILLTPSTVYIKDSVYKIYNHIFPVVIASGKIIYFNKDEIKLSINAKKTRECDFIKIVAYTIDITGQRQDAYIIRDTFPQTKITRPIGTYDLGEWTIKPRSDGVEVQIDTYHLCGYTVVRTTMLTLPIIAKG